MADIEITDPSANVLLLIEITVKRLEDLFALAERNLDKRFDLFDKIVASEITHIKELREIDTKAVVEANDQAAKRAETLAVSVATNAETLRTSVAKVAETLAASSTLTTAQINDRISALEKIQNEIRGVGTGTSMAMTQFQKTIATVIAIIGFVISLIYFFRG